jgi:hypothetical protein
MAFEEPIVLLRLRDGREQVMRVTSRQCRLIDFKPENIAQAFGFDSTAAPPTQTPLHRETALEWLDRQVNHTIRKGT